MFDSLGTTADEIAKTLKTLRISGVRNTARFLNPIVRFAKTKTSALDLDIVTGHTLRLYHQDGRRENIALPLPIVQFLNAFDHGAFPELECEAEKG
jgi:hypothetical protein